jgi:hypothetical protein
MAIIYSYPLNDDIGLKDELVGTTEKVINGQLKTVTRNFLLEDLSTFFINKGGIQKTIILTTAGSSGPATLNTLTGELNIPQYSGATDLSYTPAVSQGTVNSSTGNDAIIPLADTVNAGLFLAIEKTKLAAITGTNTGDQNLQSVTNLGSSTTNPITANSFIKNGGTGANVLLDNGTTVPIVSIGGNQNLQEVTDLGATTTNPITITIEDGGANGITSYSSQGYGVRGESTNNDGIIGISDLANGVYGSGVTGVVGEGLIGVNGIGTNVGTYGSSSNGNGVTGETEYGIGVSAFSDTGNGIYAYSTSGKGIEVYGNGTISVDVNLGNTNKGVVIDSGTSSTGNPIEVNKNGVNKLTVNQAGELTAQKLIKEGGFDFQFLKADGSVDNNTYLTSADLPSTLDLYATTSPDPVIPGYTVLVRNIADSRYNTTAVNVPTPTITGTLASPTFCGAVISDPSILLGNPGVFNFSVIGKIRRTGGSTSSGADFFYSIYKRDISGVETLIADSSPVVVPANGGIYVEYISIALWNNGIFLSTDRVVLKFYGIKSGTGSGATYEFLFGGADPVRGTAAISSAIIPNLYLRDLADVEKVPAENNEILYWNDPASLWEHELAENLVPLATATQKGLVSTASQTFAGAKTFSNNITANANIVGTNTPDISNPSYSIIIRNASTGVFEKLGATTIQPLIYNILITSEVGITTQHLGINEGLEYSQDGRNVMIANGTVPIQVTATNASSSFIASYTKLGTGNITFATSGTLVAPYGAVLNGSPGSTALLTKNGTTVYLLVNNLL